MQPNTIILFKVKLRDKMKILRQTIKSILVILIISALMINTQSKAFANSNSRAPINVEVILFSIDNSIIKQLKQELENLQEKHQIKVSVFDAKNNVSIQNEILDSVLKSKPDLIISMVADSREDSVRDFLLKVRPSRIPLILFDVSPEVAKKVSTDYDKVAFVLPDSKKAGEAQGEIIRDFWNNKNIIDKNGDGILQYILVSGPKSDIIANQRTQASISTIENSGIKTEKLQSVVTNWTREAAKTDIQNIFLKYGNKIEAVIANDDDLAMGTIEGLQKYGYNTGNNSKFIPVFGINGSAEAKELIDKGIMSGTVIEDIKELSEAFYAIGINLINNVNPIENTNLKIEDGVIISLPNPEKYIKKAKVT